MKTLIIIVVVIAAAVSSLVFCPWKHEDFFISQIGDYDLKGGSHSISIFEDSNGLLNIRTVEQGRESTWENGWIDPNEPWFLYVDKINEVWLSHGDELAYIYSLEKMSGIHSVNMYPNAKFEGARLIDIIPEKVIHRLKPSTVEGLQKEQGVDPNA